MPSDTEEQQAKEFLQRVEIRTMRKDLKALREGDVLKEKEKIAKIKTKEEITLEQGSQIPPPPLAEYKPKQTITEAGIAKNANEERATENSLKNYATEEERERIFSLEAERLKLEDELDVSGNKDASGTELQKDKMFASKDILQKNLSQIVESQKKLEGEQKFIIDQGKQAADETQKNNLEKAVNELDEQIKTQEKRRWAIEREVKDFEDKIQNMNVLLKKNVAEVNNARQRISGINMMLRDIYSGIISRV